MVNLPDFAKLMDEVSEKHRSIVIHSMIENFKSRQLDQLMTEQVQDNQIELHRDQIIKTVDRIDSLARSSARHFNKLHSSQKEINEELENINHRVTSNTTNILKNQRDISFMKEYLYAKMSPDEKIKAIKKGVNHLTGWRKKRRRT